MLLGSKDCTPVSTVLPIELKKPPTVHGEMFFHVHWIAAKKPETFVTDWLSASAVASSVPWCGVPTVINLCTGLGSRTGLAAYPAVLRKYRVTSPPMLCATTSTLRAAIPHWTAAAASPSVMSANSTSWVEGSLNARDRSEEHTSALQSREN